MVTRQARPRDVVKLPDCVISRCVAHGDGFYTHMPVLINLHKISRTACRYCTAQMSIGMPIKCTTTFLVDLHSVVHCHSHRIQQRVQRVVVESVTVYVRKIGIDADNYVPTFSEKLSGIFLENWNWGCNKILGVPSLPSPSPPLHSIPLPFLPFPSLPISPPLPLEVGPFNPARGLGKRRELPQRGLGRSPSRKRFWCILA